MAYSLGLRGDLPEDVNEILRESEKRWLKNSEVQALLENQEALGLQVSTEPPERPPGGQLFLINRNSCRRFRADGHNWTKKNDGKTVKETHEKLKVDNAEVLNCYYAHADQDDGLQRRCYWLLEPGRDSTVLVHYLNSSSSRIRRGGGVAAPARARRARRSRQQPSSDTDEDLGAFGESDEEGGSSEPAYYSTSSGVVAAAPRGSGGGGGPAPVADRLASDVLLPSMMESLPSGILPSGLPATDGASLQEQMRRYQQKYLTQPSSPPGAGPAAAPPTSQTIGPLPGVLHMSRAMAEHLNAQHLSAHHSGGGFGTATSPPPAARFPSLAVGASFGGTQLPSPQVAIEGTNSAALARQESLSSVFIPDLPSGVPPLHSGWDLDLRSGAAPGAGAGASASAQPHRRRPSRTSSDVLRMIDHWTSGPDQAQGYAGAQLMAHMDTFAAFPDSASTIPEDLALGAGPISPGSMHSDRVGTLFIGRAASLEKSNSANAGHCLEPSPLAAAAAAALAASAAEAAAGAHAAPPATKPPAAPEPADAPMRSPFALSALPSQLISPYMSQALGQGVLPGQPIPEAAAVPLPNSMSAEAEAAPAEEPGSSARKPRGPGMPRPVSHPRAMQAAEQLPSRGDRAAAAAAVASSVAHAERDALLLRARAQRAVGLVEDSGAEMTVPSPGGTAHPGPFMATDVQPAGATAAPPLKAASAAHEVHGLFKVMSIDEHEAVACLPAAMPPHATCGR